MWEMEWRSAQQISLKLTVTRCLDHQLETFKLEMKEDEKSMDPTVSWRYRSGLLALNWQPLQIKGMFCEFIVQLLFLSTL